MEALDGDDTVFYEEITRQILMLMDDDNETHERRSIKGGLKSGGGLVVSRDYFSWSEINGRRSEVPAWMERLWVGNVAGTGVFIPRVEATPSKCRRRRRNKSRKNKVNDGGRVYSSAEHMIHG